MPMCMDRAYIMLDTVSYAMSRKINMVCYKVTTSVWSILECKIVAEVTLISKLTPVSGCVSANIPSAWERSCLPSLHEE